MLRLRARQRKEKLMAKECEKTVEGEAQTENAPS